MLAVQYRACILALYYAPYHPITHLDEPYACTCDCCCARKQGTFEDSRASEEVKAAAAYALGHLSVGSRDTFLPVVLKALATTRHQYLLLSALKEVRKHSIRDSPQVHRHVRCYK